METKTTTRSLYLGDNEVLNAECLVEIICQSLFSHFDSMFKARDGFKTSKDHYNEAHLSIKKFEIFQRHCITFLLNDPKTVTKLSRGLRSPYAPIVLESFIQRVVHPDELLSYFRTPSGNECPSHSYELFGRIKKCLLVFEEHCKHAAYSYQERNFPLFKLSIVSNATTGDGALFDYRAQLNDQEQSRRERTKSMSKSDIAELREFAACCISGLSLIADASNLPFDAKHLDPEDFAIMHEEYDDHARAKFAEAFSEYLLKYQQDAVSDKQLLHCATRLNLAHQTEQEKHSEQIIYTDLEDLESIWNVPLTEFKKYQELIQAALSKADLLRLSKYEKASKNLLLMAATFERIIALTDWYCTVMLSGIESSNESIKGTKKSKRNQQDNI